MFKSLIYYKWPAGAAAISIISSSSSFERAENAEHIGNARRKSRAFKVDQTLWGDWPIIGEASANGIKSGRREKHAVYKIRLSRGPKDKKREREWHD